MRLSIAICLMCVAVGGMGAQTGLFDLSFAMPLVEADSLLQGIGFSADADSTAHWEYVNPRHLYVRAIHLVPDVSGSILAGWVVCFDTLQAGAEQTEQMTVGAVITRHGAEFSRANADFVWDLAEGRWVIARWDEFHRLYVVEYHDSHAIRYEYY